MATANFYFKLTLTGYIGLEAISAQNLFKTDNSTNGIGSAFSWNIFNAGAIRQNIRVETALQEQAVLRYESAIFLALAELDTILVLTITTLTGFTYRGLSPHKFTPMPGVPQIVEPDTPICHSPCIRMGCASSAHRLTKRQAAKGGKMKLGWLSDIHLNFLDKTERSRFFDDLSLCDVQGWLLSGDIGEAGSIDGYLREFGERLAVPTYFVLGNHDFYKGSIVNVKSSVSAVSSSLRNLVWLAETGPTQLSEDVMLVGGDCLADGRLGNPMETPVLLNDFYLIDELSGHSREDLVNILRRMGDVSSARLREDLHNAASTCSNIVVVLHVPPFEGATWHEGEISSPDWLPWFSCASAGEAVVSVASAHPETKITVFCGHTHSSGRFSPSSNVNVYTASAEYARPGVQAVIEFGRDGISFIA